MAVITAPEIERVEEIDTPTMVLSSHLLSPMPECFSVVRFIKVNSWVQTAHRSAG